MNSLEGTLGYAFAKWVAYTFWCWVGLRWAVRATHGESVRASVGKSIAAGSTRWLLGLSFGVVIFFAFATTEERIWQTYLAVYTPVRAIEWAIVGLMFAPRGNALSPGRKLAWVAGGILVSFASDMTSPEMIERGRFCVGRCLC